MVSQKAITDTIVSGVGAKALKRVKWSWLGYGVAGYVGLRMLRRFGILPRQADQAIRFIEKNASVVGKRVIPFA